MTETLQTLHTSFIITDADGLEYQFNVNPYQGANHLLWRTGTCTALPFYLLSRIRDRFGRELVLIWDTGADPRVTQVRDETGAIRLTLNYNASPLLSSVVDSLGRTHSFGYTAVPDELGNNQQKLTSVTVQGPGVPRVTRTWSFTYRDNANPDQAYGGSGGYTGDLVITKQAPDGVVTRYFYEKVTLQGVEKVRPTEADWEGRVTEVNWDDPEGQNGKRTITRVKNSATRATLTFPGSVAMQYDYSGEDLTAVTHVPTGRTWSQTFDTKHNLLTVRTPLEQTGDPLTQYQYLFDSAGRIDQVTATVRQASGPPGDPVEVQFNDLNLPAQVTAYARAGSGLPNQVTQYQYDNGTLTLGKLTQITEAFGTALQQQTSIAYNASDGVWGLPTGVTDEVGAASSFDYDNTTGLLLSSSSPANLVVGSTHPDRRRRRCCSTTATSSPPWCETPSTTTSPSPTTPRAPAPPTWW